MPIKNPHQPFPRLADPYDPETVLLEHEGGVTTTRSKVFESGVYKAELVGAGAGVAGPWVYSGNIGVSSPSGGGGAAFVGEIYIESGEYTFQCADAGFSCSGNYCTSNTAGGQTFFKLDDHNFIRCNATPKPGMGQGGGPAGGTIEIATSDRFFVVGEPQIAQNGNPGQGSNFWSYLPGAPSLYKDYGRGAGGDNGGWSVKPATCGYLKLTYLRAQP